MAKPFFIIFLLLAIKGNAQELFVFAEPASTVPAQSLSIKVSDEYMPFDKTYVRPAHRVVPQITAGLNKKLMLTAGGSFANMHTPKVKEEALFVYARYRFLSQDAVHRHFRMAAYMMAAHTKAPYHYNEVSLTGDKSGLEAGLIATQLLNRFAVSGTVSHVQVLDSTRRNTAYESFRTFQAMNYNLSAGYLLFPRQYTSYQQVGVNLYATILAQQSIDLHQYFIDLAPAVQFIFNSNTKLNVGYRSQWKGNFFRMSRTSWFISVERSFLNALKKK